LIPVPLAPEPSVFEARVREKGSRFLADHPRPTSKQFKKHRYWQDIRTELHAAYGAICAYSCVWMPLNEDATVDHYIPKSLRPALAYEWSNYRLATRKMNCYKDNATDVLDPIDLKNDNFEMDFSTFLIKPSSAASAEDQQAVAATITRLRLNIDDTMVESRIAWLRQFLAQSEVNWLDRWAPFLAREIKRQNARDLVKRALG
jgi:hypothetical protein